MIECGELVIHAIYRDPPGYPGRYVVVAWKKGAQGKELLGVVHMADTLPGAREGVPEDSNHRIPRDPGDDPTIVEAWV